MGRKIEVQETVNKMFDFPRQAIFAPPSKQSPGFGGLTPHKEK